jgi:hypothetical protein
MFNMPHCNWDLKLMIRKNQRKGGGGGGGGNMETDHAALFPGWWFHLEN